MFLILSGFLCLLLFCGFIYFSVSKRLNEVFENGIFSIVLEYIKVNVRIKILNLFQSGVLVKNKENSFIDLIYHDGYEVYVARFPKKRGPRSFTNIMDTNGVDVTSHVSIFLGPNNNFHGIKTTPAMLGFEGLTFEKNGASKFFSKDEEIFV